MANKHPIELVDKRVDEFKVGHAFLGPTCMIPGLALTDSNRAQMDASHIEQRLQVLEPEPPLMFSGYENEWGKYSSGYVELEGEWKVLAKIVKNKYSYDLILRKIKNSKKEIEDFKTKNKTPKYLPGEYHVVQRKECTHLTEKYGYQHDNTVIDGLKKGDKFSDSVLYKDNNRDDEMNLTHGRNLNTVYLTYGGLTNEDAICINKSTAIRMGHFVVKKVEVSLNTNDIFTNMYGNKSFYKSFPDLGEECLDGLLCSTRRINYATAPISLADTINPIPDDVKYRAHGKVVDIQVISNIDNPEEVLDSTYNKQIKKYYEEQQNYYKNFINYVEPIITNKDNKVSVDLIDLYNYYNKLLDPNNKFTVSDNLFDHLKLKFTVLESIPLTVGSKLAGRYGKKLIYFV